MEKTRLGRTDMDITRLCLGTMTFGEQTDQDDAFAQMDMAREAGINCFDTAELYSVLPLRRETQGESERILGRWMKDRAARDDIFVFSKIAGINNNTAKDGQPIDRQDLHRAIERSLENLQTDCIDLYQLHWPNRGHYSFRRLWDYQVDPATTADVTENLAETIETLDELKRQGKIKAYGVSNDTAWGVMKMLEIAKENDWLRLASIQNEYSLMNRLYEPDMQEVGLREDVSLLTYSSLAGGILTGKYGVDGAHIPDGSRRSIEEHVGGRVSSKIWNIVAEYINIAKEAGIEPVHFAYRFCLSQNFVGSVIIGASNQDQLKQILADDYEPLPQDVLDKIAEIRREHPIPM